MTVSSLLQKQQAHRWLPRLGPAFLVAALLGAANGCDGPPGEAELKAWTPQDHDRGDEKDRVASGQQAAPAAGGPKEDGNKTLVEMTWRNQCASCHGLGGHGDGPSGPMVHAADLTRPDWQNGVTDAQLATSITEGKGRMPKFDLPPQVVAGLVARIRASKGR